MKKAVRRCFDYVACKIYNAVPTEIKQAIDSVTSPRYQRGKLALQITLWVETISEGRSREI